jgi:hypothetical protein
MNRANIEEMRSKVILEEVTKLQKEFPLLQGDLSHLIDTKAEKLANGFLVKSKHTQLNYLPKSEQELHLGLAKERILIYLISTLRKI